MRLKLAARPPTTAAQPREQREHRGELRTEADWREACHLAYYRAKVEGERAAHRLAEEHGLELVVLCPTLVLGPGITLNNVT